MNFTIDRKIKDGIFTTSIFFKSYGSEQFTEQEEINLIRKYGCPIINAGGEPFTGKVVYDKDNNKIIIDNENGEEIILIMNSKKLPVSEDFKVSYTVDSNTIDNDELTVELNTPFKLAEAQCVLFEYNICERLKNALKTISNKTTSFEKDYPIKITI